MALCEKPLSRVGSRETHNARIMATKLLLILAIFLAAAACAVSAYSPAVEEGPRRTTRAGAVVGGEKLRQSHMSRYWRGIPYGSAARFQLPEEPEPWADDRAATKPAPPCAQVLRDTVAIGREDCLTLDVYAPLNSTSESRLPVFVWQFGGGLDYGDSYEFGVYDGDVRVKQHDVVIVSINSRVGPFAALAPSSARLRDDEGNAVGNLMLADQRLALQWVVRTTLALSRLCFSSDSLFSFCVGLSLSLSLSTAGQRRRFRGRPDSRHYGRPVIGCNGHPRGALHTILSFAW